MMTTKPAPSPPVRLEAYRCSVCGSLLARMRLTPGSMIELYCGKCKKHRTVEARSAA
jgi:phage FluMu protein Com